MSYQVRLDAAYAKAPIRRAPPEARRSLRDALRAVADNPFPAPGAPIKRLDRDDGHEVLYRYRIGDWRIIYSIDAQTVTVVRVMHRREGYGWLADMD